MTKVGTMVIGQSAELLRLDAGFCDIMAAPAEAMLGRNVLDLTAPPDRAACRAAMLTLRETGRPFQVDKRLLRPDGSTVWVTKTVSIADFGDGDRQILGTVVPIETPVTSVEPAALVAEARNQSAALRERATTFGPALFANPGWSMLLAAYLVEAEGEVASLAQLSTAACALRTVTNRWARALVAEGLLRQDVEPDRYALTREGRTMLDRYLSRSQRPATLH